MWSSVKHHRAITYDQPVHMFNSPRNRYPNVCKRKCYSLKRSHPYFLRCKNSNVPTGRILDFDDYIKNRACFISQCFYIYAYLNYNYKYADV